MRKIGSVSYWSIRQRPGRPTESIEDRFWRFVDKKGPDECWDWQGRLSWNGYGKISIGPVVRRKPVRAHRLSWEIHYGPIPKGELVLHKCDNKKCVNPSHLYLGTHSDNLQDAWDRGQQPRERPNCRGLKHGMAKLSDDDVREIRRLWKQGCSKIELSKRYGVGVRHIWAVATGRARRYVAKEE